MRAWGPTRRSGLEPSIDVFAITDVRDGDELALVVDLIQDPVVTGTQSVDAFGGVQNLHSRRTWILGERIDP